MNKILFDMSDVYAGLNEIIVGYFNIMYQDGNFLEAIELLSQRGALNTDGAYCHFPDMNSYDEEEHFEGVQFAVGYPPTAEDTVTVSEETCYQYVRLACERYIKFHPEDTDKVNGLLAQMPV